MRLEKHITLRLGCSRKEARALIRRGRVQVDGATIRRSAEPVDVDAAITVDGQPVVRPPDAVAFHKPPGVQCTVGDPLGRRSLQEEVPELLRWKLHPVGRLDADSEGLLLLLRDGQCTQRLLHPKHGVRKVYDAEVEGQCPEGLREQLASGVTTALGVFQAELLELEARASGARVRLAVTEGKHRMVRRMLANLGLPVHRLVRREMGPVKLNDLAVGQWRPLSDAELGALPR